MRLGAQLCREDGSLINLDFAPARLPGPIGPGQTANIEIELPPIPTPGRYTLKFDLVNEASSGLRSAVLDDDDAVGGFLT